MEFNVHVQGLVYVLKNKVPEKNYPCKGIKQLGRMEVKYL